MSQKKLKSKRLSENMRQQLRGVLVKGHFAEARKKRTQDWLDFFDACYFTVYSPEEIRLMEQLQLISGKGKALPYTKTISFYFNGESTGNRSMSEARPCYSTRPDSYKHFGKDQPLTKRWHILNIASDKLDEEINLLRSEIYKILASCSSTKQLLETWPESREYVEKLFYSSEPAPLPMVQTDTVNSILFPNKEALK